MNFFKNKKISESSIQNINKSYRKRAFYNNISNSCFREKFSNFKRKKSWHIWISGTLVTVVTNFYIFQDLLTHTYVDHQVGLGQDVVNIKYFKWEKR